MLCVVVQGQGEAFQNMLSTGACKIKLAYQVDNDVCELSDTCSVASRSRSALDATRIAIALLFEMLGAAHLKQLQHAPPHCYYG